MRFLFIYSNKQTFTLEKLKISATSTQSYRNTKFNLLGSFSIILLNDYGYKRFGSGRISFKRQRPEKRSKRRDRSLMSMYVLSVNLMLTVAMTKVISTAHILCMSKKLLECCDFIVFFSIPKKTSRSTHFFGLLERCYCLRKLRVFFFFLMINHSGDISYTTVRKKKKK